MFSARVRAGLTVAVLVLCASVVSAQSPSPLTVVVNGSTVTLNWSAVNLATGYTLEVLPQGGSLIAAPVGNITSITIPGVPAGNYQARVKPTAGLVSGEYSNVATIAIAGTPPAPPTPPPAPTNFSAAIDGLAVGLSWNLATTTGVTGIALQAGTSPGGADIATIALPVSNSLFLPALPAMNYFLRIATIGPGGVSAPSNELSVVTPGCSAPATLPFNVTSQGSFIQMSWGRIPGALGYVIDASTIQGGPPNLGQLSFGPTQTTFSTFGIPTGTYYLRLRAQMSCGPTTQSDEQTLNVTAPIRLPAKSYNQAFGMVVEATNAIAAQFGGDLRNSCGNNTWMFRVLQRLRSQDNRFGNNWKRGNVGDMSQDVVLYNFSDLPDDLAKAPQVYAWDIIGGHCGPNPSPNAGNITDGRGAAGWTIANYLRAGFNP